MKKTVLFGAASIALLLAACNDTAEVKDDTPLTATSNSDLTLEEVFNKTLERQQSMNSVSANMTMDQKMSMGMGEETMDVDSSTSMKMDIVNKPMQLYADGTVEMTEASSGEKMSMPLKMYMTEKDGFYMNQEDTWFKLPQDQFDAMMEQAGMQNDPSEQLKQLEQFISDFTFEQTDTDFILTLDAEGEKFLSFLMEQAGSALDSVEADAQAALEGTTIENANYVLTIDKETFDLTNMVMDLAMTMDMQGIEMVVDQTSNIDYSNFDGVEDITIPQEVIDQAQPLE